VEAYLKRLEEARSATTASWAPRWAVRLPRVRAGSAFWLPYGTTFLHTLVESMRNLGARQRYQESRPRALQQAAVGDQRPLGQVQGEHVPGRRQETDDKLPLDERCNQSLKPMNCSSHHLLYRMGKRSYPRAAHPLLPRRRAATQRGSGTLSGLTRVRQFQQDDSHIY
jgi:threonyl-tRNA synthetase